MKTVSAAVRPMSEAVAGAMEVYPAASAGASLMPSPTIRTLRPAFESAST